MEKYYNLKGWIAIPLKILIFTPVLWKVKILKKEIILHIAEKKVFVNESKVKWKKAGEKCNLNRKSKW